MLTSCVDGMWREDVDWQWLIAPFEWYGNFMKKRSSDSETQREKQSQCLCMCVCVCGGEEGAGVERVKNVAQIFTGLRVTCRGHH